MLSHEDPAAWYPHVSENPEGEARLVRRIEERHPVGSRIVINGLQVWPVKPEGDGLQAGKSGQDLMTTVSPEILYKIASHLDDVGFVCLRNSHPRIRSVLQIDALSMTPAHKYILRGLTGVCDIPNPAPAFCETCTLRSQYWKKYPDQKPSFKAIKNWRAVNVMVGKQALCIPREDHFCDVGYVPKTEKKKQKIKKKR